MRPRERWAAWALSNALYTISNLIEMEVDMLRSLGILGILGI
jgi:hypothetical protein